MQSPRGCTKLGLWEEQNGGQCGWSLEKSREGWEPQLERLAEAHAVGLVGLVRIPDEEMEAQRG